MRASQESSLNVAAPSTPKPRATSPTPLPNAFSAAFLDAARRRQERRDAEPGRDAYAAGGPGAGPFDVEPVQAGRGQAWAIVRRGETVAAGHRAVAIFRDRGAALLLAAILPATAAANHLQVKEKPKGPGHAVHDGRTHLGHLSPEVAAATGAADKLPRDLHVARFLATHPESLVHLAEALDYETLVLFGRALMRRLEEVT